MMQSAHPQEKKMKISAGNTLATDRSPRRWAQILRFAFPLRRGLFPLLAAVLLVVGMAGEGWALTCTSNGTGNWGTTGTWSCNRVPTTADTVVIQAGHTVNVTGGINDMPITIVSDVNGKGTLNINNTSVSTPNVNIPNTISGAGILQFTGTGIAGRSTYRMTTTGNNKDFTGTVKVNGARVRFSTTNVYFGTSTNRATIDIGEKGQLLFDGTVGTAYNNIIVRDNAGWIETANISLGAVRSDGQLVIDGDVELYQGDYTTNGGNGTFGTDAHGRSITILGTVSGTGQNEYYEPIIWPNRGVERRSHLHGGY
jgi:hypothetical protein